MKVETKIPVIFQNLNVYNDSRFMRVKIWLMHLGTNYNGSYFSKEAVEKAIPSLADTPILGYIEVNHDQPDFTDHRMKITIEKNNVEYTYLGQAFGVIPESNNAQFEKRVGDDGVEREYLTCEGILWNKWDTPTDIMNRDGVKSQSMELHDDYTGKWDESGFFHFEDFKFFGACILGDGVMPAMNSASIEVKNFAFDAEALHKEVQEQMEEFKVVFSKYQSSIDDGINKDKEGEVMNEKLLELLAKFSLTEEILQEKEFKLEDYSTEEELEAKLSQIAEEISATNHSSDVCEVCGQSDCAGHADETPVTYTEEQYNELVTAHSQIVDELNAIKAEFEALKEASERLTELEALTQEVAELREFKASTLAAQREAEENELFEQFADQLTEEEIQAVKEHASEMSVGDIEKELFALVGKKTATFSKKKGANKLPVASPKVDKDVTDYTYILEKHKNK